MQEGRRAGTWERHEAGACGPEGGGGAEASLRGEAPVRRERAAGLRGKWGSFLTEMGHSMCA